MLNLFHMEEVIKAKDDEKQNFRSQIPKSAQETCLMGSGYLYLLTIKAKKSSRNILKVYLGVNGSRK